MDLQQENKQLREELAKAQSLLSKQQREMQDMMFRLQKLEQEPPTSPTSIVEEASSSPAPPGGGGGGSISEGSTSSSWKNPPPISTRNMTSSSSQEEIFLIPEQDDDEELVPPSGTEIAMEDHVICRRISSITIPEGLKNTSPSRSMKRTVLSRRLTPLPTTPERSLSDEDDATSLGEALEEQGEEKVAKEVEPVVEATKEEQKTVEVTFTPPSTTTKANDESNIAKQRTKQIPDGLPPRSPPRAETEDERPPRSKRDPSNDHTPSPSRRKINSNASKGLPRETSIENHSDDDITIYPDEPNQTEFSRTIKVSNQQALDAFNDRGIYTGSIDQKSHLPDGYGAMKYRQGGREYAGDWDQGHWHGHGLLTNMSGDVYDGQLFKDQKEGKGKLRFLDGRIFEGRFQNDHMREGKLSFPDTSYYEGLLIKGKRNGFGLYAFSDGSHYEGQWEVDQMHGRGRMEWSDGGWYNGDWDFGVPHGIGMEVYFNQVVRHQGHWKDGQPIKQQEADRSSKP